MELKNKKVIFIVILSLIILIALIYLFTYSLIHFKTPASSSDAVGVETPTYVSPFANGIDEINKLHTYSYTYKADKQKTVHVGVMAQDLQKVFPNAVTKDKNGYLRIRQEDMFYAMMNSIKQLDKITQDLRNNIKSLSNRLCGIDSKIATETKSVKGVSKDMKSIGKDIKSISEEQNDIQTEHEKLELRLKKLEGHKE